MYINTISFLAKGPFPSRIFRKKNVFKKCERGYFASLFLTFMSQKNEEKTKKSVKTKNYFAEPTLFPAKK